MYPVYDSPIMFFEMGKILKVAISEKVFSTWSHFEKEKKNPRNHWPSIFHVKVEKILKGSLDSIPSPSLKILIMGETVCLRCKGKTLLGISTNFWK